MKINILKPNKDIMYVDKDNYQCANGETIINCNIKGKDNPRVILSTYIANVLGLNELETVIYNCLIDNFITQRYNGIKHPHVKRATIIRNAINVNKKTSRTYDRLIKSLIERNILFPFPTGELYINPAYDISIYFKQINNTTHIVLHLI